MPFLTSDEMERMMIEIAQGLPPERSSLAPLTGRQRGFWEIHEKELLAAQAAGLTFEIPSEWPDLSTYVEGQA